MAIRTLWGDCVPSEVKTHPVRSRHTLWSRDVPYEVKTYHVKSKRTLRGQDVPCEVMTCPAKSGRTLRGQDVPSEVRTYPVTSRHTLWGQDVPYEVKTYPAAWGRGWWGRRRRCGRRSPGRWWRSWTRRPWLSLPVAGIASGAALGLSTACLQTSHSEGHGHSHTELRFPAPFLQTLPELVTPLTGHSHSELRLPAPISAKIAMPLKRHAHSELRFLAPSSKPCQNWLHHWKDTHTLSIAFWHYALYPAKIGYTTEGALTLRASLSPFFPPNSARIGYTTEGRGTLYLRAAVHRRCQCPSPHPSVRLSVCLSVCMSVCVRACLCMCVCACVHASGAVFINLTVQYLSILRPTKLAVQYL